ncbi:MAG: outer membrane protein assembly factor [Vicinamibacterales bacterium]
MPKSLGLLMLALTMPATVAAQAQTPAPGAPASANPATICGLQIPPPRALPPANSGPVVYQIIPCFEAQGNQTLVDPSTYLYYIHLEPSRPSEGVWVPWNEGSEQTIREDFTRLWGTNFLDNLSIDVSDYTFSNGVVGKLVAYRMEERQRVKIVDFVGTEQIKTTDIDTRLREANVGIRIDTFVDAGLIRRVEGIVRDMLQEKGFQFASVTHTIEPLSGGPKLVHLTFNMDEGPKVKIRRIDFEGNRAISDGALQGRMEANKSAWFLSFITGRGSYQEDKFEEDAERILEYYRDRGFINAQIGDPELNYLEDESDDETRWVELRIPVIEGERYRVGNFTFDGNKVLATDVLRPLFDVEEGEYYSQSKIRDGIRKAQELYGEAGYFEFTGYPDPLPRENAALDPQAPAALAAVDTTPEPEGPPTVDVTMRIQEGDQYFINRINFVGNTTTRDSVIRRELRLYENGVFDTQALQYSIRRINQLGYFKPLQGPPVDVSFVKTPDTTGKVDVQFKLEEQNRNQITFGAGVSQFEGFFGQLSFQTANFMGRGESLTVSLQGGQRAQNYQLAFTEPFLFDRNISGGINLYNTEYRYVGQFTQRSQGGSLTLGLPVGSGFTRAYTAYSYEKVRVTELNELYEDPDLIRNPFLADALLLNQRGQRIVSKVTPSIVHNTIDQPIFPTTGRRLTFSTDIAGLGGNTAFIKPMVEGVFLFSQNSRMSLGFRGRWEHVKGYKDTIELPIFERLFLGGEYDVRGFDIRTIGPQDPNTGLVLGGNKSLLFNIEQSFTIAEPVRLVLFYDAGQVQAGPQRDENGVLQPGKSFAMKDFKTSTGLEVRFFMPVLNVPFRLIFAYNPQRDGVLDNSRLPQKAFQFRFAVGTMF